MAEIVFVWFAERPGFLGFERKYPVCSEGQDTKHEVRHHFGSATDVNVSGAEAFFEPAESSFCDRAKFEPLQTMGGMFRARVKGTSAYHFGYRHVPKRLRVRSNKA